MTRHTTALLSLALCLLLSGCSSVLTATREKPIEDDRGTRTIGSTLDDSMIETKVAVNVAKADTGLDRDSHIVVVSYNGIVLLAGQTPTPRSRPRRGQPRKPPSGSRRCITNCRHWHPRHCWHATTTPG